MTRLTPEFIQSKSILKSYPVPGGGGQAPGYITLRQWTWGGQWVTHFYNTLTDGFSCGRYYDTLDDAKDNFKNRVIEYERRLAAFAHD